MSSGFFYSFGSRSLKENIELDAFVLRFAARDLRLREAQALHALVFGDFPRLLLRLRIFERLDDSARKIELQRRSNRRDIFVAKDAVGLGDFLGLTLIAAQRYLFDGGRRFRLCESLERVEVLLRLRFGRDIRLARFRECFVLETGGFSRLGRVFDR